ncbi:MAG: hypothetical protein ACE5J1_03640 [Nitrospiria bacterium]
MDMLERSFQLSKRKLLRKYEKTCPIELATIESILEDFIRECQRNKDKPKMRK